MQIIFVGLVIAAYIVRCGAAMAVVFAQEKAKGDGDPAFWPPLSRLAEKTAFAGTADALIQRT